MSNQDQQQYDGVIFGQFEGLKNTVARERLKPSELEIARNIDIDDAGQIRSRRGQTKKLDGVFHSLYEADGKTYVVKDGALGIVYPDFTFAQLKADVGPDPLAYAEAGSELFFSSALVSGRIKAGVCSDWGAHTDEGLWLSPVVNPTATLPAIRGQWLGKPKMATALAYYSGRVYMAEEALIWCTLLYNYSYIDRTRNFYQFESKINVIGAVTDGLYVGTENDIWFMAGTHDKGLKRIPLAQYGALKGSLLSVPAELLRPQITEQATPSKNAVVFMTNNGLVAGFDGGELYNLTQPDVLFPYGRSAAAMFRQQDGLNQYVAAIDHGGTPVDSARIGDYVDVEIVREVDRLSTIVGPNVPVVTVSASLYKIGFWFDYPPLPGDTLIIHDVASAFTFDADFAGSQAVCNVNPTSQWIASIQKNGVEIGAISITITGVVTFSMQTQERFYPGDVLKVMAPATADLTIGNCAFTLRGM